MGKRAEQILIVFVTASSRAEASKIAGALVTGRLVGCVSIIPTVTSIFRWKGKVQKSQETLMMIKSTEGQYSAIERAIRTMHSYDVPEIISVPVIKGLPQYVDWLIGETTGN